MRQLVVAAAVVTTVGSMSVDAFAVRASLLPIAAKKGSVPWLTRLEVSTRDEAFSAFADSLDEEEMFDAEETAAVPTWQESLEALLDPSTPLAKRQILLSDLLNANESIRNDVQTALRDRKIDVLLTPTGRKLQDGTRAVARQLTIDILPSIANMATSATPSGSRSRPPTNLSEELPSLVPKITSRIWDAFSSQARKQLELLQGDLADPSRIPRRISKQTAEFAKEAKNVFADTPENYSGPSYTTVSKHIGYEIRDYQGYTVASTSMAKVGELYSMDDVASAGAAFNALAAYIFGANEEGKSMEMTTPVSTTSVGEMRFYLKENEIGNVMDSFAFPTPKREKENRFNERGAVKIVEVPPARLAVARFTGFVTEGEVSRQKDALLSALALDGVIVDVPHGAVVPHVIFQYNPPYTLPFVRRNEIAVPVMKEMEEDDYDQFGRRNSSFEVEWGGEGDDYGDLPSDVE